MKREQFNPNDTISEYETKMKSGQGEMETQPSGALRESNKGRGRFDLLPYEAMESLAVWYELGAYKYADRNWEKGLSTRDCVNRMIRHALKVGSGWTDEDHLAAVMWNAATIITMQKRMPEYDDHQWIKVPTDVELDIIGIDLVGDNDITTTYHHLASNNYILEDDRIFLTKAISSGGIGDFKTLYEWVGRRLNSQK